MFTYLEKHFDLANKKILGVDEAGRGNWAGPMVVAGCILNLKNLNPETIKQINDSKKLNKQKRSQLFDEIINNSRYEVEIVQPQIIDQIGPKNASKQGMKKIIEKLIKQCDLIFVDFEEPIKSEKLYHFAHADALSINVAAASIIAKHLKDLLMQEFCLNNPNLKEYKFEDNAGYGTKSHLEALKKYGKIPYFHRYSYKPVAAINKENLTTINWNSEIVKSVHK